MTRDCERATDFQPSLFKVSVDPTKVLKGPYLGISVLCTGPRKGDTVGVMAARLTLTDRREGKVSEAAMKKKPMVSLFVS